LATGSCGHSRVDIFRLELLPVILNEIKLLAMTTTTIEIVVLHLSECLVVSPMIVVETIYGAHDSGAMPASGAVHVKLAGGWIISNFQEASYLVRAWIAFVNDGN